MTTSMCIIVISLQLTPVRFPFLPPAFKSSYSDTITRSGVFCALFSAIQQCKIEQKVDVYQAVKKMRMQKPCFVKTEVGITNCNVKKIYVYMLSNIFILHWLCSQHTGWSMNCSLFFSTHLTTMITSSLDWLYQDSGFLPTSKYHCGCCYIYC